MKNPSSRTLRKVIAGDLCTGCGLCAGLAPSAISLQTVAPGYTRPIQHQTLMPTTEKLISRSCPGALVAPWQAAPHRHPYWGPYHRVLTGHATDAGVRHAGSSGGVITALALFALRTGLVDKVVHVTADPEQPTRNRTAISDNPEAVLSGAGSRYAPSSPLHAIDALLSEKQRFAFIGKPCDVSALRQLATVDARVDMYMPVMLAFFCAGVPSHDGADRIVRQMGLQPPEIARFRYRGNGWPGMTRAETKDGRVAEMSYEESWGGQLSKQVQFRCKICPDAVGGVADVAAADAWYGGDSGYPQFEEQDGRSLIMTRTLAGENLLNAAERDKVISIEKLEIWEIDKMQPAQARRKRTVMARLAACMTTLQPRPKMKGLDLVASIRRSSLKETASNFAGTARRILQGRR